MVEEFTCPGCGTPLEQVRMEHGVFWLCRACGGRALNVELLRRTFSRESINPFWLRVISGEGKPGRLCPCCQHAMIEVAIAAPPDAPRVDVCRLCHFVWFDANELAAMKPRDLTADTDEKKRAAARRIETGAALLEVPPPHEWWQGLARFLMTDVG